MAPRRPSRTLAVAALALALAAGCAAPSLGPPTYAVGGANEIPVGQMKAPWPPSTMTHRAILSIDGSEIPLDGRLAVGERGALRLVALGAMGQVVFDLLAEPDTAPRVLRAAPAFPEAWARDFAARDIDRVFRAQPAMCRVDKRGDGELLLVAADGTWIRHLWTPSGSASIRPSTWSHIEGVRSGSRFGGDCVYRVSALEPRSFAGLDNPVPSRVRIEAVDYALDIRIVELKPGPPPERLFRPAVEGTTEEHR